MTAEARGGSRWTDRIIELADEIDAADLRGDGRIQQACVKLREVARSFPVGEPDEQKLKAVAWRAFQEGFHGTGSDARHEFARYWPTVAEAAVAAVRAAQENPK